MNGVRQPNLVSVRSRSVQYRDRCAIVETADRNIDRRILKLNSRNLEISARVVTDIENDARIVPCGAGTAGDVYIQTRPYRLDGDKEP